MSMRLLVALAVPCLVMPMAVAQDAAPAAGEAKVVLRERGAEPREAIRLALEKGSSSTLMMDTAMSIEMSMAGQAMPAMALPTTRATLEATVSEAGEESYTVDTTLRSAEVVGDTAGTSPMIVEPMKQAMASISGTSFQMTMTPRGKVTTSEMEMPAGAPPEARSSAEGLVNGMQGVVVMFPEEAVGVGAMWTVTAVMEMNGIEQTIETDCTLSGIEDGVYVIDFEQRISAPAGPLDLPEIPAGMTAELVELSGTGAGTVRWDVSKPLPLSLKTGNSTTIVMEMSGQGMSQQMRQAITTAITTPEVDGAD